MPGNTVLINNGWREYYLGDSKMEEFLLWLRNNGIIQKISDDQLCPKCENMVKVVPVVQDDEGTIYLKCLFCNQEYFDPIFSNDPLEKGDK